MYVLDDHSSKFPFRNNCGPGTAAQNSINSETPISKVSHVMVNETEMKKRSPKKNKPIEQRNLQPRRRLFHN